MAPEEKDLSLAIRCGALATGLSHFSLYIRLLMEQAHESQPTWSPGDDWQAWAGIPAPTPGTEIAEAYELIGDAADRLRTAERALTARATWPRSPE